jgi:F420-dependent oxidoreductase-like protein
MRAFALNKLQLAIADRRGRRRADRSGRGVMRIALMIEGQEDVSWADWLALAEACEEFGVEALFRSDHYMSFVRADRREAHDAWTTIAALASRTTRLRLGTCVSPATFRHPANLAKAVATIDHVSGGRVELGLGAGWFTDEFNAFGFPFPGAAERQDILDETVEIVCRIWTEGSPFSFSGRHFQLSECQSLPQPVQRPRPPLIIGGNAGPRSAALAARWADEYNVNNVTPPQVEGQRARLAAACETIGRDPASLRLSVLANLLVGTDTADLHTRAAHLMERDAQSGSPTDFLDGRGPETLTGTSDEVLTQIDKYARAGADRIMLQHWLHRDLDTVELIGRHIQPAAEQL